MMDHHRPRPLVNQDPPLRNARPRANPLVGRVVDGFQVEVGEDRGRGARADADGAGFEAFAGRHGQGAGRRSRVRRREGREGGVGGKGGGGAEEEEGQAGAG
mmetsp:Transcript_4912/g.10106  ORF Transcript_4912/g.10106 Transcript_4912/m.10106 type:complete len:102 (+) Transcript_4912:1251-1556(+)